MCCVISIYNYYVAISLSIQSVSVIIFLLYFRVSVDKEKEAISDNFTFACTLYRALALQHQIVCSLMLQHANYSLPIGYINNC